MPIYEYICEECQARYEHLVLSKEAVVSCPKCGSERHTLQLSTFNAPRNGAAAPVKSGEFTCIGNPSACGCGKN
jgi:putative FmdB family regulatory protein